MQQQHNLPLYESIGVIVDVCLRCNLFLQILQMPIFPLPEGLLRCSILLLPLLGLEVDRTVNSGT